MNSWRSLLTERLVPGSFELPFGVSVSFYESSTFGTYAFCINDSEYCFYLDPESLKEFGKFLLLLSKQAEEEQL